MNFWIKGLKPYCNDFEATHPWFNGSIPHCIAYDAMVTSECSSVLTVCPTASYAIAAWLPLSSFPEVLNSYLLHSNCCSSSHAPSPINICIMASFGLHSHPPASSNSGLLFSCSTFSPERTLLDVISGVDEGVL